MVKCSPGEGAHFGLFGFPIKTVRENQSSEDTLQYTTLKNLTIETLIDTDGMQNSDCMVINHPYTTEKGSSGSPYLFMNTKTPSTVATKDDVLNYIYGLESQQKISYNTGIFWSKGFTERLREIINEEKPKIAADRLKEKPIQQAKK